jgi:hypothetical protein
MCITLVTAMSSSDPFRFRSTSTGLIRSYTSDLRLWAANIGRNYALASAFVIAGLVCLIVGFGIATSALFSILATRYGPYTAYEVIGGAFLLLGIIGTIGGLGLFKRELPPLPRPGRPAVALKRSIALPAALRFISGNAGADLLTQSLVGGAAVLFLGWIVASRRSRWEHR